MEDKRVDGSRRTGSENLLLEKWERRSKGLRGPQMCLALLRCLDDWICSLYLPSFDNANTITGVPPSFCEVCTGHVKSEEKKANV